MAIEAKPVHPAAVLPGENPFAEGKGEIGPIVVTIHVDDRLRMPLDDLSEAAADAICVAFMYRNPEFAKAKAFGFRGKIPRFIATYRRGNGELSVPRGGIGKVRFILREHGLDWSVVDRRACPPAQDRFPPSRVTLYPFQERMVCAAMAKQNLLWRCPQGGGKTTAALEFIRRIGMPALVVVGSGTLLEQWTRRAQLDLGMALRDVGVIGAGKNRRGLLTIGMAQTLTRRVDELRGLFGTVVQDEVQTAGAASFQNVVDHLDAKYRLGVSGDERRADHKEFLVYDQFGEVGCEVTRDELETEGFILPVEVRVVLTDYGCPWWLALAAQPARRGESEEQRRQRVLRERMDRQVEFVTELTQDVKRNALVVGLAAQAIEEAGQVIVLSARREHCHSLDSQIQGSGLSSGLLIGGEDYADQFADTLRRFVAGDARAAVGTYQAIGVGFDVPQAARGVFATPVANSRDGAQQFRQFLGRFARRYEGKQDAAVYYLLDVNVFGLGPLRNLLRWCRRVMVETPDGGMMDAKEFLHAQTRRDDSGGDDGSGDLELGGGVLLGAGDGSGGE